MTSVSVFYIPEQFFYLQFIFAGMVKIVDFFSIRHICFTLFLNFLRTFALFCCLLFLIFFSKYKKESLKPTDFRYVFHVFLLLFMFG